MVVMPHETAIITNMTLFETSFFTVDNIEVQEVKSDKTVCAVTEWFL